MVIVEETEFKGNKILVLKRDENDKFGFSFGKTKAKMIVEAFDKIKEFVEANQ